MKPGGYAVEDANGTRVAYIYGRDDMRGDIRVLTLDEARRIAAGIAKLPVLLRDHQSPRPATPLD